MAYEIPQNLKYEEKIVFGLTLPQFGWITLFGILAAIIFLKTNLDFTIKAVLSLVLMLLGLAFAFLGLRAHTKMLWTYFFGIRNAGYTDPTLTRVVQIKQIQNDSLLLTDGTVKAVIQIQPLHFSILSMEEQRAIIGAYRDFLNSLDFPIQIVVRTIDLSMKPYLASLQKKVQATRKPHLETQFQSFKEFIEKFLFQKHVKNRLFYAIIPAPNQNQTPQWLGIQPKNDEKTRKAQLDVRVRVCQDKLKRCNLLTRRLETNELVALTGTFFEGYIDAQNDYFANPVTLSQGSENHEKKTSHWINALGQKIKQNLG